MNIQARVMQALTERAAKRQALADVQEQATKDLRRIADVSNAIVGVLHELADGNDFSTMFSNRCEEVNLAGKVLPEVPRDSFQRVVEAAMKGAEHGRSCIKAIASVSPDRNETGNAYVVTFTKGADADDMECRLHIMDIEHMGYSPVDEYWSIVTSQTIELGSDMSLESDVPGAMREAMERVVEANLRGMKFK